MGPLVQTSFERLGVGIVPLYFEPDGDFPNHLPDPEVPNYMRALSEAVLKHQCDCGLGFDGDGDRVGVLDENGRKISADWLVALFARRMLKEYPGGTIRFDVKCSDFLGDDIRANGGNPVMGETGHSLLKRDVKALDAILGGELSGHIVFNRGFVPIDDSLFSALQFLKVLDEFGGKASQLFLDFPNLFSTAEIKLPCSDQAKMKVVADLVKHFQSRFEVLEIDGARVSLRDGWFLVRASHTTPNLTVRFEGRSHQAVLDATELLRDALRTHPEVDTELLDTVELMK
jgi:phosphomannomutase/phosphoglucomutase